MWSLPNYRSKHAKIFLSKTKQAGLKGFTTACGKDDLRQSGGPWPASTFQPTPLPVALNLPSSQMTHPGLRF